MHKGGWVGGGGNQRKMEDHAQLVSKLRGRFSLFRQYHAVLFQSGLKAHVNGVNVSRADKTRPPKALS